MRPPAVTSPPRPAKSRRARMAAPTSCCRPRQVIKRGRAEVLRIGDTEVEYNRGFRLYLQVSGTAVPPALGAAARARSPACLLLPWRPPA